MCSFPNSHVRIYDDRELRIGSGDAVKLRYDPPSARLAITGRPWSWGGAVFVDPRAGRIGVGVSEAAAPVHLQRDSDGNTLLVRNTTPAGNTGANIVADAQTPQSRLFHGGLASDSVKRISIEASGRLEWGPGGAAARDTNLYRKAANTLATDDDLRFDATGRGPIVRSPNGTAFRITVADDGRLGAVRV
jgi:hypothetical protein